MSGTTSRKTPKICLEMITSDVMVSGSDTSQKAAPKVQDVRFTCIINSKTNMLWYRIWYQVVHIKNGKVLWYPNFYLSREPSSKNELSCGSSL